MSNNNLSGVLAIGGLGFCYSGYRSYQAGEKTKAMIKGALAVACFGIAYSLFDQGMQINTSQMNKMDSIKDKISTEEKWEVKKDICPVKKLKSMFNEGEKEALNLKEHLQIAPKDSLINATEMNKMDSIKDKIFVGEKGAAQKNICPIKKLESILNKGEKEALNPEEHWPFGPKNSLINTQKNTWVGAYFENLNKTEEGITCDNFLSWKERFHRGGTGYIDGIKVKDVSKALSWGIDPDKRPFIAIKHRCPNGDK